MSIPAAEFRRILGHLAAGVTVVTATDPDGAACGLTASAVSPVSLDPPLVLVCVSRSSTTHDCIVRAGAFAASILGEGSAAVARRFAEGSSNEKFEGVSHRKEATGAPILDEALAWVDCALWATYDGGDHTIFVGRVATGDTAAGAPLIHFQGGFARLAGG
jgi:flavin reductase (DIM6/NTAB) family NADH-FMN oxidoreductase RutF